MRPDIEWRRRNRRVDPHNVEVMDDGMAAILRTKTGSERLRIAFGMYSFARRALLSHVRTEHPEWSQEEVRREAARRLSHGTG